MPSKSRRRQPSQISSLQFVLVVGVVAVFGYLSLSLVTGTGPLSTIPGINYFDVVDSKVEERVAADTAREKAVKEGKSDEEAQDAAATAGQAAKQAADTANKEAFYDYAAAQSAVQSGLNEGKSVLDLMAEKAIKITQLPEQAGFNLGFLYNPNYSCACASAVRYECTSPLKVSLNHGFNFIGRTVDTGVCEATQSIDGAHLAYTPCQTKTTSFSIGGKKNVVSCGDDLTTYTSQDPAKWQEVDAELWNISGRLDSDLLHPPNTPTIVVGPTTAITLAKAIGEANTIPLPIKYTSIEYLPAENEDPRTFKFKISYQGEQKTNVDLTVDVTHEQDDSLSFFIDNSQTTPNQ